MLAASPHLKVLATSRERLGIPGERNWPVPPLTIPSSRDRELDRILKSESARLFLDRASAVLPAFSLAPASLQAIAEICRRLDGIPLAIELAAARMNVLTPVQIAARLADSMSLLTTGGRTLPRRQQTLRAAIDWSYALLNDRERTLFRRLAVFGGLFTLDECEAICSCSVISGDAVLDLLASLSDKSLVAVREVNGEARYRLLDTVRQFAAEQLRDSGEELSLRRAHALHFHDLVRQTAPRLQSALRPQCIERIAAAHDNIRAALDWTRKAPGLEREHLEMAGGLWFYWVHRVYWDEALRRYATALELPPTPETAAARAQVLYGAGVIAWVAGRLTLSADYLWECVALRRELGDTGGTGMALCALAHSILDPADPSAALRLVNEGMLLVRRECSNWDLALVLTMSLGYVSHAAGRWDEAELAYEEAEALWSEPRDDWGRSFALNSLAAITWRRGQLDEADRIARESLALLPSVGDRWFASRTLLLMGYIALARGDNAHAATLLGAAEALRREVGARLMVFEQPEHERVLAVLQERLGPDAFEHAWSEGLRMHFAAACAWALGSEVVPPRPAKLATLLRPETAPAPMAELTIRALGALEIRRGDRLLTAEEWTYAKPRELLFLLLESPDGCTKEQVGLALWPDASPAKLRSSFHVTLHHLRRVLGRAEWVSFEGGRYQFDRSLPLDYDATRFEALARPAIDAAASEADPRRAIASLQDAVALYRGDFLEDAGFGDWHLEHRDALRRLYLEALFVLADAQFRVRDAEGAAATCRRLLGSDNLSERAHRQLIRALASLGRRDEAVRHYGIMQALLREELGITPDRETEALVARVRAGQAV
jgi:predicted ATPase/DNA-binding SARP family transcriptional activator